MKIAFFEANDRDRLFFEEKFRNSLFFSETITSRHIGDILKTEIISVKSYSKVTAAILKKLPNLRFIATRTTGFDHIDAEYCKINNILLSNVPAYGSHTVAEHAMALLLSLSHNIVPSVERTRKHAFSIGDLQGFELFGKTIGVVGTGNIGLSLIEIAKGFGMKVIAYSLPTDEKVAKRLGFDYVGFETLLGKSDIISLHVPYVKATHHLIHSGNIRLIKKGCILINTARGAVVETKALISGLDSGIFAALGLDVLEEEELMKTKEKSNNTIVLLNNELLKRKNVLITPHNGFNSKEAVQRILDETVVNIQSFLNGNPKNMV